VFSSLSSLETGLLYACVLFVTTTLQFSQISDHYIDDSLAIGLTNPTTLGIYSLDSIVYASASDMSSFDYIIGVMYQLCGIFSVSIALLPKPSADRVKHHHISRDSYPLS
jgi:hypothetical protein